MVAQIRQQFERKPAAISSTGRSAPALAERLMIGRYLSSAPERLASVRSALPRAGGHAGPIVKSLSQPP
ncbi:hypothetical protein EVAR_10380_1 [Eumeta japonica]|uniref:Uncharacterized protein n=1 Tax=Eumeta variegata TaxID=151549 RepID=A0A4C1UDX8_EUMVA|nr:hypothetical protein EVAR_10380_1 [Eumeta japonica]